MLREGQPTPEERLQQDISQLKDPERHKGTSLEVGSLQQAIDIVARLKVFVASDQGGMVAWKKLQDAVENLEKELNAKLTESNTEKAA